MCLSPRLSLLSANGFSLMAITGLKIRTRAFTSDSPCRQWHCEGSQRNLLPLLEPSSQIVGNDFPKRWGRCNIVEYLHSSNLKTVCHCLQLRSGFNYLIRALSDPNYRFSTCSSESETEACMRGRKQCHQIKSTLLEHWNSLLEVGNTSHCWSRFCLDHIYQ